MNTQELHAIAQWHQKKNQRAFQHWLARTSSIDWNQLIKLSSVSWISKNVRAVLLPKMKETITPTHHRSMDYAKVLTWFNDDGEINKLWRREEKCKDNVFKDTVQQWCHFLFHDREAQWRILPSIKIEALTLALEFDYHERYPEGLDAYQCIVRKIGYSPTMPTPSFFHKIPSSILSETLFDNPSDQSRQAIQRREAIQSEKWIRQGNHVDNAATVENQWLASFDLPLKRQSQTWNIDTSHGEFGTTLWFKEASYNQLRKMAFVALWLLHNQHPIFTEDRLSYIHQVWLPELYAFADVKSEIEMHNEIQSCKDTDLASFLRLVEKPEATIPLPYLLEHP